MSFVGNFPHVQVEKEPKSRTQHDNMKENQGTTTAEKEDDTDSTATKTSATFTSSCESDWDDYEWWVPCVKYSVPRDVKRREITSRTSSQFT